MSEDSPESNAIYQNEADARAAGLVYVTDLESGICRKRRGKGFTYLNKDKLRVKDQKTLERINALVIPPAWTDVWICACPREHLQATDRPF